MKTECLHKTSLNVDVKVIFKYFNITKYFYDHTSLFSQSITSFPDVIFVFEEKRGPQP